MSFKYPNEKEILINANVAYHFNFSIYDENYGHIKTDEAVLRANIEKGFKNAVFYDSPEADKNQIISDLKTTENFIHGSSMPFARFRVLIEDYELKKEGYDITGTHVLLTIFPETDTVQLVVGLSIANASVDDLVYIKHMQGNGDKLVNKDGRQLSVKDIFKEVSSVLQRNIADKESSYTVEIKTFGNESDIKVIYEKYNKQLYGIMRGDEGWRHVPREVTEDRLSNYWENREFARVMAFARSVLFLNLSMSESAAAYRNNRAFFDKHFNGEIHPYFLVDSDFCGINHGVFLSIELVMLVKTICNRILRIQAKLHNTTSANLQAAIKQTKFFRAELLTTLSIVEALTISMTGELKKTLLISQQIDPVVDKLKYLLELVESELDLMYTNNTNKMVNVLTVAGLVLTLIATVAQLYSVFG